MTTDLKMTPARRRGLATIALKGRGRRSNDTDIPAGRVYWQTCDALAGAGLIEPEGDEAPAMAASWVLTAAGRSLATELGYQIRETG